MSDHESTYVPRTGIEKWLDSRLPIIRFGADYMSLPTPRNLNYWYTFGGILMLCLVIQIVTGIVLAMHYVPNTEMAFASVERIMRDVNGDMLPDIYVCNDFFYSVDKFWINQGGGVFKQAGPGVIRNFSMSSMSVDFADINRDGHDDFFVAEISTVHVTPPPPCLRIWTPKFFAPAAR